MTRQCIFKRYENGYCKNCTGKDYKCEDYYNPHGRQEKSCSGKDNLFIQPAGTNTLGEKSSLSSKPLFASPQDDLIKRIEQIRRINDGGVI